LPHRRLVLEQFTELDDILQLPGDKRFEVFLGVFAVRKAHLHGELVHAGLEELAMLLSSLGLAGLAAGQTVLDNEEVGIAAAGNDPAVPIQWPL
jgi:hypothetical protein